MRIAIIGTGIGGLAAALACRRAGIDFELFDHTESPLSGGAALTLWPNALIGLNELGVFENGMDWLHFIHHGHLRTDKNADLYGLPLDWMKATYGFQPSCVTRTQLIRKLRDSVGSPTIRKAHCERVSQTDKQVSVYFSNGSQETFDGAIAADGIHSVVRRQLIGDSRRAVHYTAWRGIAIDAHVPPASMCEYLGKGIRFGYSKIDPSQTYWFATVNNHLLPSKTADWSTVADQFSGFPETVRSCIERTPRKSVIETSVEDVLPGAPMAWNNVAFLGDAAHAITPNLGLGACLAIEDAKVLCDTLQSGAPLKQAFARYAQSRRDRVAKISRFTRWLGQTTQMEQQALIGVRNATFRVAPTIIKNLVWKAVLGSGS